MRLARKTETKELAFGKVPAYCRYELFMERYRSISDFIGAEHRQRESLRVLDVGSGAGFLKRFCDFGNIEWHGVDTEQRSLKTCTKLGYRMVEFDIDGHPLPYPDEHFDVVVACHVIEHLVNLPFCLHEMSRVLKHGGLLVTGIPVKPPFTHHLLTFYHRLKTSRRKGGTTLAVDVRALKRLLRKHLGRGFRIIDLRGFRLISARRRANWENNEAFYRANVWFGKLCPSFTREVNVVMRKEPPADGLGRPSAGSRPSR